MSNGIWLSGNKFMEFAENACSLTKEMAIRNSFGLWMSILPDPDPVLRKSGDGYEELDTLAADYKVLSSLQTRKLKTLGRSAYSFSPGTIKGDKATPDAVALCDALTKDLERVDLYNLISEILDAPGYGMTVAELLWQPDNGRMRLVNIIPKPREWFAFDAANRLRFLGEYGIGYTGDFAHESSDVAGTLPPYGKFVMARHFPTYKNPYGLRLLSRCLFPVAFKRGGIEFMMRFAEKWGMPWLLGKAKPNATQHEMREMTNSLAGMVLDAVAVVNSGSDVQILQNSTQAGDLHLSIVKFWDEAIAQVLVGQTLTSTVGDSGSYAASKTHGEILGDYAHADAALIKMFFDEVAWTYTQINAPGTLSPVFAFEDPENLDEQASLGEKLYNQGVRFTPVYYERRFGLSEDEFSLAPATSGTPGSGIPSSGPSYAEKKTEKRSTPGQQSVEDLVEELLPKGIAEADALVQIILAAVDKAKTPEEVETLLEKLLLPEDKGGLPTKEFTRIMETALFAADMTGRFAGRENIV